MGSRNKLLSRNPELEQIGSNLAKLRNKKGWSQSDLSIYSDVDLRTIQRIELGQAEVKVLTLKKLVRALNADSTSILGL